jgi:hypothetical protein
VDREAVFVVTVKYLVHFNFTISSNEYKKLRLILHTILFFISQLKFVYISYIINYALLNILHLMRRLLMYPESILTITVTFCE